MSGETKMKIDYDCYNFLSEDDFSEDDDYMDKKCHYDSQETQQVPILVMNKYLVNPNPI